MTENPLYLPIILGTARQGRQSEHVANFLLSEMKKRPEIETEVIDVRQLKMTLDDAGEEMKDPEFAKKMTRADGLATDSGFTPEAGCFAGVESGFRGRSAV
jgi:NAD(P)H-dependent FMN reductase